MNACQGKDIPVEIIERWLKDSDWRVRKAAMNACQGKDIPVEIIERWLKDSDCDVRQAAMNACQGKDIPVEIIERGLKDSDCDGYKKVITYTTRPKRDYETAGNDYHFISEKEFLQLKEADYFIETACYNGWYYGTAKKDCDTNIDDFKNGYQDNKVIVLTPHGLRNLQKYSDTTDKVDITSFYICVPRRDRLIKILERNDNVDEAIRRNMSDVGQFDGIEDEVDFILTNDNFQFSVWEMAKKVHDLYR